VVTPDRIPAWQAFRAAPEAQVVVDARGAVLLVNVEAERLFARTGEHLVGQPLGRLLVGDPLSSPPATTSAIRMPDGRQLPVDVLKGTLEGDPSGLVVLVINDQGPPGQSRASLERRVRRLTELDNEKESLLSDLIMTQERERARIAAGVHDDSLQVITAAMLRMQQLRKRLHDQEALAVLARVEESIALAADRLRRLIFDFRPPALERAGLAAAVRDVLSHLRDDLGIDGSIDNQLAGEPPLPARLLLYRMIQEALANVGKHAEADCVDVRLSEQDGGYLVRVVDNGVGGAVASDLPEPGHLGMVLMRERAAFAGGWFRVESPPGGGTHVSFWVPSGADLEHPSLRNGGSV
jgi:signal transduction histidine kinase